MGSAFRDPGEQSGLHTQKPSPLRKTMIRLEEETFRNIVNQDQAKLTPMTSCGRRTWHHTTDGERRPFYPKMAIQPSVLEPGTHDEGKRWVVTVGLAPRN